MKFYGINATAKETGITESTLRRWESQGFFTADRVFLGDNEMRMYSDGLVDLLRRVKNVIDSGMRVRAAFDVRCLSLNLKTCRAIAAYHS